MPDDAPKNQLVDLIRAEIRNEGAISFARFMELCLYCPVHGYYERKEDTVGRRGDFYTSVSVGPLFGEMLALQFADWLAELDSESKPLELVEAGAHDGRLALDILKWLQRQRPQLFNRLRYVIIEPSSQRQQWQRETLKDFLLQLCWQESVHSVPQTRFSGVIFCNELLDAFPVHRITWDAATRKWFEWGVSTNAKGFEWTRLKTEVPPDFIPPSLSCCEELPDGYTIEVCPEAEEWWRAAASALKYGKLVTIDYGLGAEELFTPGRANGTLRAYSRHRQSGGLLERPGGQDLTAHINFTAIQAAGEQVGLRTEAFVAQATFLTENARRIWGGNADFGEWTSASTRQFQTLTHPEYLGRSFKVLVQSR